MSLAGRRVLVTGAGGFIGSHLAERLAAENARVRAMVHYNALGLCGWLEQSPVRGQMEIVAGDITDPDSIRDAMSEVEVVFHLAALIAIPYSYRAPLSYVHTNINGTLNVLQAARGVGHAARVGDLDERSVWDCPARADRRATSPARPIALRGQQDRGRQDGRGLFPLVRRTRGHGPSVQHFWPPAIDAAP